VSTDTAKNQLRPFAKTLIRRPAARLLVLCIPAAAARLLVPCISPAAGAVLPHLVRIVIVNRSSAARPFLVFLFIFFLQARPALFARRSTCSQRDPHGTEKGCGHKPNIDRRELHHVLCFRLFSLRCKSKANYKAKKKGRG
jgi:hypothetical protein